MVRDSLPYAKKFAKLIESERAEVVHFNTARGMILAGWGAHLARRNTVMHVRGSVAVNPLYWGVAQCLADCILLVARALMPEVFPSARSRARVLYNGVHADLGIVDRAVARRIVGERLGGKWALDEDIKVFVSLSSPTPFKGLHYLVDAAAVAKSRGVKAMFLLAGEPKADGYCGWLTKRIDELGLSDTVRLLGFVDDTHNLLCAADALVLPSVLHERIEAGGEVFEDRSNEGLPRSILEAMVAGIPSIASDIAGVSEQIQDGHNGILVPPKDAKALATAIEELAMNTELCRLMGARAKEVAKTKFRIEDAGRGLLRALSETANENASAADKLIRWPIIAKELVSLRIGAQ
ncbi:MAG: glycosyltransferase [Polyangiaceae bacterium]|nr:glycosyltransferase [Polyangiaceae bacterium]